MPAGRERSESPREFHTPPRRGQAGPSQEAALVTLAPVSVSGRQGIGSLARRGSAHSRGLCSSLVFALASCHFELLEGGGGDTVCHRQLRDE